MKNKIVDSHCHLDFDDYSNDLDKVIHDAKLNDVKEEIEAKVSGMPLFAINQQTV